MIKRILIILIICWSAIALNAQRPKKAYRIGKASYENGEYIRAVGWLTLAINSQKKKFDDAYLYRGKSYLSMNRRVEAAEDFKIATQILPSNVEAPLKSARLMLELKEYTQALQYATITLDRDTANFEAMKLQAMALANTGSAESALITIDAIAQFRTDAELLYIKAVASDSLGLTDYAIAYYKEAIDENKVFKPAYHALGILLAKNGHYIKSVQTFSQAAKRFNDEESYYYRSLINNKLGHKQSEIVDITKILTLNSSRIDLYYKRAILFKEQNLLLNALSDIDIYLRWDSISAPAWIFKARLLNELLMSKKALFAYKQVLKISDNQEYIKESEKNIFELNTEDIPPVIELKIGSINITHAIMADKDANEIVIKGTVTDDSKIESVKVNGTNVNFGLLVKNKYVFKANINSNAVNAVTIQATDVYGNTATMKLPIVKTHSKNRTVFLTTPNLRPDSTILATKPHLTVSGYYMSDAFFSTLKINGKEVSGSLKNNKFYFTDRLEINNIDTLIIEATDVYANIIKYNYPILKEYNVDKTTSTLGKTWVVVIAADNVDEHVLPAIRNHRDSLIEAYKQFNIDSLVVLSGRSKESLERDLLFSLPQQLAYNRVDAILLHYIGPGIKEGSFSYLIVDGDHENPYAKINTSFFKTVISALGNTSFRTLIMETIVSGKSLINASHSNSYANCSKIDRIPDQGVFLLSVPIKNWFTYQSPVLKSLTDSITNNQNCFMPTNINQYCKDVIFGGSENNSTPVFPVILYKIRQTALK